MGYAGGYAMFLQDIRRLHAEGMSPHAIAAWIRAREIDRQRRGQRWNYVPSGSVVLYILRREGLLPWDAAPLDREARELARTRRCLAAVRLRLDGWTWRAIGKELGNVSPTMATHLWAHGQQLMKREIRRRERWWWQHRTISRPLDMKGRREVWHEFRLGDPP